MMFRKDVTLGCTGVCVTIGLLFVLVWTTEIQLSKIPGTVNENRQSMAYQIPPAMRLAISVRKKCTQTGGTELKQIDLPKRVNGQIFVSDRYRLLFCWVPKIASSNIKRLFLVLDNIVKTRELGRINNTQVIKNSVKIRGLKDYSLKQKEYRLRHYKKVMFTREPFERLLSAYKSKFENGIKNKDGLSLNLRDKALTVLNIGVDRGSKNYLTELSFPDYVRFLVNQARTNKKLDHHFAAQIDLCDPCTVDYDYIGTYENIDEDMSLVLNEVGAGDSVLFPTKEDYYTMHDIKVKDTKAELHEYYSKVPATFITQLQEHLTGKDAELFGYERPNTLTKIINN